MSVLHLARAPLSTGEFIIQAQRRGFLLDTGRLRQLYRRELLVRFVYASGRQVSPPPGPAHRSRSAALPVAAELRQAGQRGFVSLVERAALLQAPAALPLAASLLARVTHRRGGEHFHARLPEPDHGIAIGASRLRSIAIAVTALEARYLPALTQNGCSSRTATRNSGSGIAPASTRRDERPSWLSGRAGKDAEFLLRRARSLDPLPDSWMRLISRAPRKTRDDLTGTALLAMDYREAAEILLLYCEDQAGHSQPGSAAPRDGRTGDAGAPELTRSLT